jgi:adenine phosphoribosyltransferase
MRRPDQEARRTLPGEASLHNDRPDYRSRAIDLLLQEDAVSGSDRVVVVDDWLEIGSQAKAAVDLIRQASVDVVGVAVIVDDSDPAVDLQLPGFHSLIRVEPLGPSGS